MIGIDSHLLFQNSGGSPYTYLTAMDQPLNEGKVFLFKIAIKDFFNDVKPPKEYLNRISDRQLKVAELIEKREFNVNLGYKRFFNTDNMKHYIAKNVMSKK